jgi:hypothetical protein
MNKKILGFIILLDALLIGAAFMIIKLPSTKLPKSTEFHVVLAQNAPDIHPSTMPDLSADHSRLSTIFGESSERSSLNSTATEDISKTDDMFILLGILKTETGSIAVIKLSNSIYRVKTGQHIGDWKIKSIDARSISLANSFQEKTLALDAK